MSEFILVGAGLLALWKLSNDDDEHENFRNKNTLPNTNILPNNFPKQDYKDINVNNNRYVGHQNNDEYNNKFKNNVDKFYMPDKISNELKLNKDNFKSLTGTNMKVGDLEHNNMVPFFGSNVTQVNKGYENILDMHTGGGSQQIEKRGIAPMFKPEQNMSHIHGTPSTTEYMQNRIKSNLTQKLNNTKPWEEIRVGPGLNKGYGTKGSGGFNSGLESRESYLPKNVDQLRVTTNPKNTYGGVLLGAKGITNERGVYGKMEKNRPDTYYENTADRWFTTTGLEKAQRARGTVIMQPGNRTNTTTEYFGTGNNTTQNGIYQKGNYKESNKEQLCAYNMGVATKRDGGNIVKDDYGKKNIEILPNSRSINKNNNEYGIATGIISAITAPILDIIRPTRKENIIGNKRPTGNASGPLKQPIHNPYDKMKTTIKEQTIDNNYITPGFYDNGGGYETNKYQPVSVQRDTTNIYDYKGGAAPSNLNKPEAYTQYNNSHLNPNKEILSKVDRYNIGNHNLFNNSQNVTNMANRSINPVRGTANMPKAISNMAIHGTISGKNTRERFMNRNGNEIVSVLNNNPYAQSLHSVA